MTPALMKKLAFVPLMAAIGGLLYLPFYGHSDLGQMQVQAVTGHVEIIRGNETLTVDGKMELRVGDLIKTAADGAGRLRLTGKRSALLAPSSSILVSSGRSLTSRSGRLLVRSEDPTSVAFGDVTARADRGTFRIDQGFASVRAASYEGRWHLTSPGQASLDLPYLFQATVTAGQIPRAARPYQLKAGDLWEGQYLADVLHLDRDLSSLALALSTQLGSSKPGLSYFGSLAGHDVGFMHRYLGRPTQDLLIGFTVAQTSRKERLAAGLDSAFRLKDAGGSWGVVAKILRARQSVLVSQLDRLIVGTGIVAGAGSSSQPIFALAAPQPGGSGLSVTSGGSGPNGSSQPSGPVADPVDHPVVQPTPAGGKDPGTGGDQTSGGDNDPNGQPQDCTSETDCAAQDVINRLPHASPSPSPSPSPGGLIPHSGGLGG